MLFKKALILSVTIILSCGYISAAKASTTCQDKFSYAAFGSLEKSDMDRLKQKFLTVRRSPKFATPVYLGDVQGILGFSGQQTKVTSNGKVEHRIWVDRNNCKRQVKGSFMDRKLVKIKSYGF